MAAAGRGHRRRRGRGARDPARPRGHGPSRAAVIADAWRDLARTAQIDDPVGLPGTGLVGFGALTFDEDSSASSVVRVPSTILGYRAGRSWITRIRREDGAFADDPTPTDRGPRWSTDLAPGAQSPEGYRDAVRRAVSLIREGALRKVVLSRDLTGSVPAGADLRQPLRALAAAYPDTWAFAVDGLIGASPETLVTVQQGVVTARVLAGTAGRGADAQDDAVAAQALTASAKDREEHGYAVRSVLTALEPHTRTLHADAEPFLLELPNLFHLATDVEGALSDGSSVFDLLRTLHPTAAVGGTPTAAAVAAIRELEPFDRGRYAGPVGWVDAAGNGEWAVALRCAQFASGPRSGAQPLTVTAYAGAGIVAASDPESELRETRVKFRPLIDAVR